MFYFIHYYAYHHYPIAIVNRKDLVRLRHFRSEDPLFLPPRKFRCVASNTGRWKPRPRDQKDRRTHRHLAPIAITLLLIVAIITW